MLYRIHQRYGERIRSSDDEIGEVRDFYFDDQNWTVRYVVADTGGWLKGRLVLLSPHAFGELAPRENVLFANLTRKQIEGSPSIDEHKPVYRQEEEEFHRHYGFPYYAQSTPLWGLAGHPVLVPPPAPAETERKNVEAHLRSTRHVQGYKVGATDGPVGKVEDFLIDGETWVITKIVIKPGDWHTAKELIVPTENVARISYEDATLHLDVARAALVPPAEPSAAESGLPTTTPSIRKFGPDL